ncbi:hypothetical protein ACIQ7S_17375 [Streptomyces griseoluteus]|uniref:hypothetical protein n=1 Tax=Streptomyces griseoluteus TaxID=29306 RepID=UPI00332EA239
MFDMIRKYVARLGLSARTGAPTEARPRGHNLFEAAAAYVAARARDDQDGVEEASSWVSPEALSFGVGELASRAVVALAHERSTTPRAVARDLLGLPAD